MNPTLALKKMAQMKNLDTIPTRKVTTNVKSRPEKPWHQYLTLDLIVFILERSVFHPFICFLVPLCLRAQLTPYSHPAFIYTTAWAVVVSVYWVLSVVNHRLAYGKPRHVNFGSPQTNEDEEDDEREEEDGEQEEVVLITGGCSGLGRLLAEIFGMRGVSVAVLDVREPEGGTQRAEDEEGWKWYRCDVGNAAEVRRVKLEVERDVCILFISNIMFCAISVMLSHFLSCTRGLQG